MKLSPPARSVVAICGVALWHACTVGGLAAQEIDWLGKPLKEVEAAAEAGVVNAQVRLALMNYEGIGMRPNRDQAAALWKRAALAGNPEAQHRLASSFVYGSLDSRHLNRVEACVWLRRALAQDYVPAYTTAGRLYMTGYHAVSHESSLGNSQGYEETRGVPRDFDTGIWWFERGAEKGEAACMYYLGWYREMGWGEGENSIPPSTEEAVRWYRRGADAGHPGAIWRLARSYQKGLASPRDENDTAVKLLLRPEAGHHPEALFELGRRCRGGHGVPKDFISALNQWLHSAVHGGDRARELLDQLKIDTGHLAGEEASLFATYRQALSTDGRHARLDIARRYLNGRGVPQDDFEARVWFSFAYGTDITEVDDPEYKTLLESGLKDEDSRLENRVQFLKYNGPRL